MEFRFAERALERLPALVAELVAGRATGPALHLLIGRRARCCRRDVDRSDRRRTGVRAGVMAGILSRT